MAINTGDPAYFFQDYGPMGGESFSYSIRPEYAPFMTQNPSFSPDSGTTWNFDEAGYLASLTPAQVVDLGMTHNAYGGMGGEGSVSLPGGFSAMMQNEADPLAAMRTSWDSMIAGNYLGTGFGFLGGENAGTPMGADNIFSSYNNLGTAMGMSPDEIFNLYNSSVTNGFGAGFGGAEGYRQMLSSLQGAAGQRGFDLSPYSGYTDYLQQLADQAQAISDADNDFGLAQFLPMVALAALGGGAALGGMFAPASATALGAGAGGIVDLAALGGIAGGGFGSVVPGVTAGIGGSLGGGLGAAGAGEGLVGWDAAGGAISGGTGEVGSLAGAGAATGGTGGGGAITGGLDPTSAAGAMGGAGDVTAGAGYGWTPMTGYNQLGGTLQTLGLGTGTPSNPLSSIQNLLGGGGSGSPTSGLSGLVSGLTGGGGAGTGTSGTGGGFLDWLTGSGTGGAGNIINGLLTDNAYEDQGDFLRAQMDRAWGMSDPYGYGPYRTYAAQQLQRTYQDPLSIWQSPEMQAWDTEMQNTQLAKDAAAGQLFNAPERLAQRERGFLTQLGEYRKPLMQMSGSQFAPDARGATSLAGPIVANELARNMNQGALVQQGLSGLGGLLGTGGTTFGSGSTGGLTDLATSLSGLNWGNLFGGGGSGGTGGWTMQDTNIWNTLGNLGEGWGY